MRLVCLAYIFIHWSHLPSAGEGFMPFLKKCPNRYEKTPPIWYTTKVMKASRPIFIWPSSPIVSYPCKIHVAQGRHQVGMVVAATCYEQADSSHQHSQSEQRIKNCSKKMQRAGRWFTTDIRHVQGGPHSDKGKKICVDPKCGYQKNESWKSGG